MVPTPTLNTTSPLSKCLVCPLTTTLRRRNNLLPDGCRPPAPTPPKVSMVTTAAGGYQHPNTGNMNNLWTWFSRYLIQTSLQAHSGGHRTTLKWSRLRVDMKRVRYQGALHWSPAGTECHCKEFLLTRVHVKYLLVPITSRTFKLWQK